MSDFSIAKGNNTPEVKFNKASGTLYISGKSYPENAVEFYDNIFNKIKTFTNSKKFTFELDFEYLSSSSIVCFLEKLKKLKAESPKTDFTIKFYYENGDEDMLDIGEKYAAISEMQIEYLQKK